MTGSAACESDDEWAARVGGETVRRWRAGVPPRYRDGEARPAPGTITQVATCALCRRPITSARHPVTVWVHEDSERPKCDD